MRRCTPATGGVDGAQTRAGLARLASGRAHRRFAMPLYPHQPHHRPEWPPPHLPPAGPGLPGWLEERLFDQRIVMLRGHLSAEAATGISAALLTLDSAGPEVVHLHVASPGGDLSAALSVVDVLDALTA